MSATDMDLKAVRKQLGLTQLQLGAIVYLTPRQLSKIESGRSAIPKLVAEKLADMIGKKNAIGATQ